MKFNQNQKRFIANGALWAVYEGFNAAFLSAFALALGASNTVIGILSAMPFIAAILGQIPGTQLVEYFGRKKVYVVSSLISRLLWILMILTPYYFSKHPLLVVIIAYFLIRLAEYLTDPAWTTTAADITPVKNRGALFGTRNVFLILGMTVASTIGAIYLDLFPKNTTYGFTSMFIVGILFGIMAVMQFARIKMPPYSDHKHHCIKEFFTQKAVKSFTAIAFFFNFAYAISSPLFAVYILKDLGLSYKIYIGTVIISSVMKMVSNPHLGKITDKYGDKPVAVLSIIGTAMVPLLYLFITPKTLWILIPAQIISGIAWAGADLSMFNLLLDFTEPKKRAVQIANYTMITCIPLIFAPIIGGILADNIKYFVLAGIPFVFFISTVLRLVSAGFMMRIKEPRVQKEYKLMFVLRRAVAVHPEKYAENFVHVVVRKMKNEWKY